ncbi:LexA family transcriptional regulator [Paenibacillus alvei]|nr:LexA family transcriptional regulator [Paenibacillus alvei]EJW18155.1 putative SOS-response transcriptional repressor [Paenibacillus alvei DSM 29]MCY9579398.1 LexA family transcriptional regulator [Paenibacillus alvei]MCY9586047.1 LexA family transcriptional regulator [Paenibacillus alvei]
MNYHELLRKYIADSGLRLNVIAEKLKDYNYNVSKSYISQLQNGKTPNPATDELNRALAEITGGDVEKLLFAAIIERAPEEVKGKLLRLEKLKSLKTEYTQVKGTKVPYVTDKDEKFISVPVLDSITYSKVVEAGKSDRTIYIDRSITQGRRAFALHVSEESMIGDHITIGDVAVCLIQEEVTSNDIAIVAIEEQNATLRRVKFQNDICMLMPSNAAMQPILVASSQVKVLGKVVEVRRTL